MSSQAAQAAGGGVGDHGLLTGLGDDDHAIYALLAGRAGGQVLNGGTAAADNLTLAANSVGTGTGRILANSPIVFGAYSGTTATYGFSYTAVEAFGAAFIGGGLNFSGTISFTNSTFIYESFRGSPSITTGVNPGFAAYTVLQALPAFHAGSGAGHNPLSPLVLNAGVSVNHAFTGTRTVGNVAAINFASTARTTSTGILNVTAWTGITVAPKWSTAAGSTVNFGSVRGVWFQNPTVAPFGGSSAGVETATALIGLEVDSLTAFGTTVVKAAVRSAITAGTNRFFLLNNGGAASLFGSGIAHFADAAGVAFGNTYFAADVLANWNGSALEFAFAANSDDYRISNPSNGRFLFQGNAGIGASGDEFTIACARFSLGAQTGTNGNQVGAFVAGARSTSLGGEWSDFLLTQAANLTVNAALSLVAGWTINAPSITLGTGTVTTAGALNVGGNVNQGSVNRFGVRILSNPTGGSGVNAALWVTAGLSRFDGRVDVNQPIALGGGATPTFGTIGGTGPTAAAQAQWVEIDVNGVAHWIPAWT